MARKTKDIFVFESQEKKKDHRPSMVEVLDDRGVLLSLGIGRKNLLIAQLISVPVTHVNVRSGDCSTSYLSGDML